MCVVIVERCCCPEAEHSLSPLTRQSLRIREQRVHRFRPLQEFRYPSADECDTLRSAANAQRTPHQLHLEQPRLSHLIGSFHWFEENAIRRRGRTLH